MVLHQLLFVFVVGLCVIWFIHELVVLFCFFFFFFKQKTAYEMRISDWSSDVCSSDLMAELSLLPAVRKAEPNTLLVADGTSCRHQIADGEIGRASCRERVCQYV